VRRTAINSLALFLLLLSSGRTLAQFEPRAVIERALQVHGGARMIEKYKGVQMKGKGAVYLPDEIQVGVEGFSELPGKFKSVMEMDVNGMKLTIIQAVNGDRVTIRQNGVDVPLNDKLKEELKEQVYADGVASLIVLRERGYKLAPLGETKVNDRDALGIKISSRGHRDVSLYFDKASGFLVKIEDKALDVKSMQEVLQEKILDNYKDFGGIKRPTKVVVRRDGKPFGEMEITDVKIFEKLEDANFEP